jgi:hypothetical protein
VITTALSLKLGTSTTSTSSSGDTWSVRSRCTYVDSSFNMIPSRSNSHTRGRSNMTTRMHMIKSSLTISNAWALMHAYSRISKSRFQCAYLSIVVQGHLQQRCSQLIERVLTLEFPLPH